MNAISGELLGVDYKPKLEIAIRRQGRVMCAWLRLIGPKGSYVLRVAFDFKPIIAAVARVAEERARSFSSMSGVDPDRLYEIGFFSKLFKWVKKTVKKIANSGFIRAIAKGVKWLVTNPLVKGIVGIVKHIPIIGPAIAEGHKAISGVARVVDKAVNGNPMAKRVVAAVAQKAKEGNPTAMNIAKRMEDHVKTLDPGKVAATVLPISSG